MHQLIRRQDTNKLHHHRNQVSNQDRMSTKPPQAIQEISQELHQEHINQEYINQVQDQEYTNQEPPARMFKVVQQDSPQEQELINQEAINQTHTSLEIISHINQEQEQVDFLDLQVLTNPQQDNKAQPGLQALQVRQVHQELVETLEQAQVAVIVPLIVTIRNDKFI